MGVVELKEIKQKKAGELLRRLYLILSKTGLDNGEYFKTGKRELDKVNTNLSALIHESVHLIKIPAAIEMKVNISTEKHIWAFFDSAKIKQVLINIIDNAVKYSFPKGSIEINAFENRDFVTVRITDTGAGIDSRT